MSKWIDVKKDIPPYGVKVLVMTKGNEVVVGKLIRKWETDQALRGSADVLCWQPLDTPELPVGGVSKNKKKDVKYLKIVK